MIWIQDNGLTYLKFPLMAYLPGFFHGIFIRRALNAQGNTEPFNLGMGCGTAEGQVRENRQRMLKAFGNGHKAVYARQVHGTQVGIWNSKEVPAQSVSIDGDALVTAQEDGALVIQTADCQPVIVIDPVRRVAANIHSGWRGSVGNIIRRTIETMIHVFGSRPQDLMCGIGPSLGPCCAQFVHFRREIPRRYWGYRRSEDRFDFWRISVDQLTAAGVLMENIDVAGICTKCNQHLFFSYRGDQHTGRFASVVGIRCDEGKQV